MLSVIAQHSKGSVPKRCSGGEKDQRSAFTGAQKIQSEPHRQGEADAKEGDFKNLFIPPQGTVC